MDDAMSVGMLQPSTNLLGDPNRLLQRKTVVVGSLDQAFDIAPAHQLAHKVGLSVLFAQVIHGDDVRVIPEAPHCLGFAVQAGATFAIQALGFDKCEGDIAVELGVMAEVDALLPTLAEE